VSSVDQKFLDNICKILGHSLTTDPVVNDGSRMVVIFEKTCSRCGRSGKATIKYIDLAYKKYDIFAKAKELVEWNFNSSPHKKL
jgi:hypothetical protein